MVRTVSMWDYMRSGCHGRLYMTRDRRGRVQVDAGGNEIHQDSPGFTRIHGSGNPGISQSTLCQLDLVGNSRSTPALRMESHGSMGEGKGRKRKRKKEFIPP